MPLYSNATLIPCQWVMFPRLALRSFQGMAFVALRFALRSFQGCLVVFRSFQGCVPFVPAAAVASKSKIFMGLQYIVCARCPRGGGVHRERRAVDCYGFSMVLAGSTSLSWLLFFISMLLALVCY